MWHTNIYRKLFGRLYTAQEMKGWKHDDYLAKLYLYHAELQYKDNTDVSDALAVWGNVKERCLKPIEVQLEPAQKVCLEWLRSRFVPGEMLGLPLE